MVAKKYTKKEKTAALKRLKAGESVSVVSRDMNIPRSTLIGWRKSGEVTGACARKKTTQAREENSTPSTVMDSITTQNESEDTSSTASGPPSPQGEGNNLEEAKERVENKRNFSKQSWTNIEKAQKIIERRLNRALDYEDALDALVDAVLAAKDEDLSYQEKQALLNKLRKIKVEDLRELTTVIGTLFDKQRLANDEATDIIDGGLYVDFNIPRPNKDVKNES